MRPSPLALWVPFLIGTTIAEKQFHNQLLDRDAQHVERAGPDRVLTPAVHWTVPTSGIKHVPAQKQQKLYYADEGVADPSVTHHFGTTELNYTVPAVNLDHSDHVNIDSAEGIATITFATLAAFDSAYSSWNGEETLLLLTYQPLCSAYSAGEFCYIAVSDLQFNSVLLEVTADAKTVNPADYIVGGNYEFGLYTPAPQAPSTMAKLRKVRAVVATSTSSTNGCQATDSYGLPAVALGPDFDQQLDDCRGYEPATSFDWYDFAEQVGADQDTISEVKNMSTLHGTDDLIEFGAAEAIASALATSLHLNFTETINTASTTASPTTSGGGVASNSATTTDTTISTTTTANPVQPNGNKKRELVHLSERGWGSWIPIKIPFINKPESASFSKEIPWSIPQDRGQDDSPWGKAKLLSKFQGEKTSGKFGTTADGSISIYCVNCGVDGSVTLYGQGAWDLSDGLTEGHVTATANINIGFALGIDAQGSLNTKKSQQIAAFAIPGLSFGIIAVGPMITLGADFVFTAEAQGQLLAGARFILQNAQSTMDFVNPQNSGSSGWTPQFVPIFEASGQISVGAELGLPVGLSVGVNILNGKYVKGVGVVERPSLEAKAEFAAEANTSGANVVVTDGCAGVATQINFKNELYADIDGTQHALMDPYVKNLAKGCIKVGSSSSSTVSPTTVATTTAPSTTDPSTTDPSTTDPSTTDPSATDPSATDPSSTDSSGSSDPTATDSSDSPDASGADSSDPSGPDSSDPSGTDPSEDFTKLQKSTIPDTFSSTHPDFHGFNTTGKDKMEYTELVDSSAKFFLTACPDNNVYLQPRSVQKENANLTCGRVFESHSSNVVGDAFSRLFHYYSDSMDTLGVSRLRLHDNSSMPLGSVFVDFEAFSNTTGTLDQDTDVNNDAGKTNKDDGAFYIARNQAGDLFYPALCVYQQSVNIPAKVFLVKDQVAGLATLQSPDVQTSITGGAVDQCYLIPFRQATEETGSAWDDQWNVSQGIDGATAGQNITKTQNY